MQGEKEGCKDRYHVLWGEVETDSQSSSSSHGEGSSPDSSLDDSRGPSENEAAVAESEAAPYVGRKGRKPIGRDIKKLQRREIRIDEIHFSDDSDESVPRSVADGSESQAQPLKGDSAASSAPIPAVCMLSDPVLFTTSRGTTMQASRSVVKWAQRQAWKSIGCSGHDEGTCRVCIFQHKHYVNGEDPCFKDFFCERCHEFHEDHMPSKRRLKKRTIKPAGRS